MKLELAKQILSDLVSFEVLGGQSNLPILNYIKAYLDKHGVGYIWVPNSDNTKASLTARIGPANDGGVILSGHMDVVPVEGQDWDTDPFKLTEIGDRLFARGSCDMKGFVACCLAMVPDFLALDLKRPIYFAFSYDEEIGCLAGVELANSFHKNYKEKPKYAIIGEPSMMQPIAGHKGIIFMKTTIHGSAGHSSRIKTEVSSVHVAARLVCWLEDKMNSLTARDNRFTPNHSSIHVGMINGGIAPNVIADKCDFMWDVRNIPHDDINVIIAEYIQHCDLLEKELQGRFAGARIEHEEIHPIVIYLDTPEDASVINLIREIGPRQDLGTVAYAAEAGQFSQAGFESVICGPGDIAQAHRANEFVDIEQLELCLDMLGKLGNKLRG
jgi:acetylornithine deacetylase